MVLLEVCANSVTSALAAQEGGAARVELCENLPEGGTSPSYGQIAITRKLLHIPINVLIRPRAGDFLYSDAEYEIMEMDVEHAIQTGCNGVVIGILDENGNVDMKRCSTLVDMAHSSGLSVTFHRAFDVCRDQFRALEDIIELGCDRVLTSGGRTTAIEGSSVIAQLNDRAAGRIIIMPGSGINQFNVKDLVQFTRVKEIHASAKSRVKSRMLYQNNRILMVNHGDGYDMDETNTEMVKRIIEAANGR